MCVLCAEKMCLRVFTYALRRFFIEVPTRLLKEAFFFMAAGGPVLAPDLDAIAVTPLASHSLSAHPVVLSMGAGLEFEIVETGDMPYAYCIIDGQVQVQVQAGTRVSMTTAPHRFRHLVQSPNQFWDVLVTKFGFAGMARSRC